MALTRIKTNQITDLAVTSAKLAANSVTSAKLENNLTYGSDFTVTGNLTVSGTTTSVSTTNTRVEDAIIALSAEATGSASVDSGLLINRGADDNQAMIWDESEDQFIFANVGAEDGDTAGNVTISSYAGVRAGAIVYGSLNDGTTTLTATVAELNALDGITSSVSELNILTGVTADSTEINKLDGVTSSTAELNILTGVTSTAAEISLTDGSSAGTIVNSKAVIYGSSGEVNATTLQVGGVSITSTPAELNILSGATLDVTELNYVDGVTSSIQTQLDAKLNLAGGTMSGNIAMGTNSITGMADPSAAQDAATKAYVDGEVSSASVLAIAGDSGTDNVTVGSDTFTFSGTANEVTTAVTNNTLTFGLPSDVNISNDLTVAGNLTVSGTTTTLSTTNSVVEDSLIEINTGASSNANDLGLIFERGSTGDNAVFAWDESVDKFTLGTTTATGASTGDLSITAGTLVVATLEGNVTGNVTGSADTLTTARAIEVSGAVTGTANFDGSAAINIVTTNTADPTITLGGDLTGSVTLTNLGDGTLTATIAANSVALGTDTTGNYVATITGGNGISSTGATSGETIAHSLSVDLTDTAIFASDGTASRAVVLDASGDFTARNITATDIDGILGSNTAAAATVTTLDASDLASLDGGIDVDGAFIVADTSGNISTTGTAIIGSATATTDVTLKVDSTDSMMVPAGTTGQRPTTGVTGMLRFNSTLNSVEYYDNSAWSSISSDFTLATSQTFNGDDSTVAFTLTALSGSDSYTGAGVLVMLNGIVQEPTTVYGITGTTLTFTTAPATGDLIEVRKFTTTTTVNAITDGDGDTQIQLEESADEDIIRFDIAGSEKMTLTATQLSVTGNIVATGNITANGDITLGDANTDTITLGAEIGSDIIPDTDGSRDLGSTANRWAEAHIDDIILGPQGDVRFSDSDASNWVAFQAPATVASNVTWTLPAADAGTSGFALVSDASGTLSWAAAGATTTSDTTTNAEEQIYFGDITSGAVTAMHHDADLTYNPSTGTLTSAAFAGNITGDVTGDVTGNADTATALATARAIQVSGAVTGTANFDGSSAINIVTTNTADPTVTLTGAVTGSGTLTNLGDVTITTTATADPTLTLAGDATGSATFTNLGNATLTVTIADDSHNHIISNVDGLQAELDGKLTAGATSGSGISGSASSGTFTVTSNATSSNTGNTIVFRDGSGNFTAGIITGTATAARYADLAEMYAADAAIEPGTVVHFAGDGKVAACDVANCRAVAGIISTDPAHLMNSDQEGVALALAGRVPCKVTGPVAAGDLMVSAGNGMAMANNEAAMGTVIGKAIEANEGGEGVIEVLALMM